MNKEFYLLNGILLFYILQRLSELVISKSNEKWLKEKYGALEVDPAETLRMKVFHSFWFVSLIIEANIKKSFQPDIVSLFCYMVLVVCLTVRIHTMEKLKRFWIVKVMMIEGQTITTNGLFQYIRHPNYLIVILELLFIPFLVKAYFTMVIFTVANIYIQWGRIKLEEETLMKNNEYRKNFMDKKRFVPYIFSFLLMCGSLPAAEISKVYSNFHEASASEDYIRFSSESTKMGIVTTPFTGFARRFSINYELKDSLIEKLLVTVDVKEMDTDNTSRNDKMINTILDSVHSPKIIAELNKPVILKEGEQICTMIFSIKDKKVMKPVKFTLLRGEDGIRITGSTSLKLSEADLPDPSIFIAKVRDEFEISFSVSIPKGK